jgi:hypothetical protein
MRLPNNIVDHYRKGKVHAFPSGERTNPRDKTRDYLLSVAEAIFNEYVRNRTGIYYNMYPIWEDNRMYGSESQYRSIYRRNYNTDANRTDATSTEDATIDTQYNNLQKKRRGEAGIDYSIVSLAKRIKNTVHGMFDELDWDVSVDIVDAVHKYEEKYQKFKLYNEVLFAEHLAEWRKKAGLNPPDQRYLPKSEQELDAYAANGGFKLNTAISLEKLLKHTFTISDWDDVKYKFLDDALDFGVVGGREYYDIEEECIKMRYADPSKCGIQYSEKKDFSDSDYAFEVILEPLSKLQSYGFTRDELKSAAKKYQGEFGNPVKGDWGRYDFYDTDDDQFMYFQVPVMDFEIIDTDVEYQNVYSDTRGRARVETAEWGKVSDGENKKTRLFKYRKAYGGKWIIGTKLMYEYGELKQQYKINKKPRLSFKFIKITDKPIIEQIKPMLDDMMHAWVRYQKASILAANSGYAINARLLQNIQMGDEDWNPEKVIQFMRETGYLLYSDTDEDGQYRGGEVRPVHELPGGMKQVLEDSINRFKMAIQMIQDVTGLNLVAMESSPLPQHGGKAIAEIQQTISNNVIRPYEYGVRRLKKVLAQGLSEKIRLFIRTSPKIATKTYSKVVGLKDLYALKIADDTFAEYGLSFEPTASNQEKADILIAAEKALQPGKDGVSQIKFSDWLNLKQMLTVGTNLKLMNQILAYQIEKYEDLNIQRAREAQMIEEQKNANHQQRDAQMKEMEDKRKLEGELVIDDRKAINEIKKINAQGRWDEKIKQMELNFKEKDEILNYQQVKSNKESK